MDFFNIGPFELLLILILAFLFFGPEKLPGMAAKAGKLYHDFRKATLDIGKTVSEEISIETKTREETKNQPVPQPNEKITSENSHPAASSSKSDGTVHD
jgi:TatA/E family protein of Tat protein translocase